MDRIWKVPLHITDFQSPVVQARVKKVLSVGFDAGSTLCLWVRVELNAEDDTDTYTMLDVRLVGTGNPMPTDVDDGFDFIGTAIDPTRPLVWHVFTEAHVHVRA
jgi:hypothetical protein